MVCLLLLQIAEHLSLIADEIIALRMQVVLTRKRSWLLMMYLGCVASVYGTQRIWALLEVMLIFRLRLEMRLTLRMRLKMRLMKPEMARMMIDMT